MERIIIITPKEQLIDEECEFVTIAGDEGQVGILPNHIPLIMKIANGYLKIVNNDLEKYVAIIGGVADNNKSVITVIAQEAAIASSLEEAKLLLDKIQSERIKSNKAKMVDFVQAEQELAKAIKDINASDI